MLMYCLVVLNIFYLNLPFYYLAKVSMGATTSRFTESAQCIQAILLLKSQLFCRLSRALISLVSFSVRTKYLHIFLFYNNVQTLYGS